MATLQCPVASRIIAGRNVGILTAANFTANQLRVNSLFINARFPAVVPRRNNTQCRRGGGGRGGGAVTARNCPSAGGCGLIRCRSSSFDDGDNVAGNSAGGDHDFVNASVIDAVAVKNGSDGFLIKMRNGRYLRCAYNNPKGGYPPDYISHPAIVLKLEDGSGLLLPIIVLEMPSVLLMAALHNIEMARPTVYQVVKEMIDNMGFKVKCVRVTKRVQEAYFAELCVIKVDDEAVLLSLDLRPSDAINIAVRCKAPVLVNKSLAHNDGLKMVEPVNSSFRPPLSDESLLSEMDRPDGQPCPESEEFVLLRNMLIAAVEERYHDAAHWKDLLKQFRSGKHKWT